MDEARTALETLTRDALASIAESPFGVNGCRNSIAYHDERKDALFTGHPSFQAAVDALANIAAVQTHFGAAEARRLAIQFVYNVCNHVANGLTTGEAFGRTWEAFAQEASTPTWTFSALANIQNLECSVYPLDLGDGVSIRGRSFAELSAILHWTDVELEFLSKDWSEAGMSSFVMLVQKQVPKTPENFLWRDDGTAYTRAARALLAMRLCAPGDIRIGRLFYEKPAAFNVGIGGMQMSGFSVWNPGPNYHLVPEQVPDIRRLYGQLNEFDSRGNKKNLALALRSFSSIYDRTYHQAEDRILDAVTALEAVWKLDSELSFKLAFRTASLLAISDDERVLIYETLRDYYGIRSKVVHGSALSDLEARRLNEDEPLRNLVRRALRAFLFLVVNPGDWSLNRRFYKEVDAVLLHTLSRTNLQAAMGLSVCNV
jgi:hypothetical protein